MVRKVKASILGVEYTVILGSRKEVPVEPEFDGLCYIYDKIIYIVTDKEDVLTQEGKYETLDEILYHEVAHAFIFESGYTANSDEESLVVWLSKYTRRINNCVLEILDDLGELDKDRRL